MPPKQHSSSLWRQWEKFTVSGVRIKNRRYTANEALFAWLAVLVFLFLMRQYAYSSQESAEDDSFNLSIATDPSFWQDRHLVFTVSAGRGGSKHLSNVLDAATDIIARHEPDPQMNGDVLKEVLLRGRRAESFMKRATTKLGAIREELESTAPDVTYAETSHMFAKTYSDVIMHYLGDVANITVVVLQRPLRDVVWSQLRLGWFSPHHSGRDVWYYDVADLHATERMVSLDSNLTTAVDKLIAYNADVRQRSVELRREIRKKQAKGLWKRVRIIDVRLGDISSRNGVSAFLSRLGLQADEGRQRILSEQDSNSRSEKKERVHVGVTQANVDSRIDFFANKLPMLQSA